MRRPVVNRRLLLKAVDAHLSSKQPIAVGRRDLACEGRVRNEEEEMGGSSSSTVSLFLCVPAPRPHSAVASQLVPRWTWRHLVSVSTGAGAAEGCGGRLSSAPAADARLQGVIDAFTPEGGGGDGSGGNVTETLR